MYAGVIRSAVHTAFRRSLAIATVHARFNLTQMTYEGRKKREGLHLPPNDRSELSTTETFRRLVWFVILP